MRMNTKIWFPIIVGIIVVVVGFYFLPNKHDQITPVYETEKPVHADKQPEAEWVTYQGITYTNSQYVFKLTLPPDWNGFKVQENSLSTGEASAVIRFALSDGYTPFYIKVYSIDAWNKIPKERQENNGAEGIDGYFITKNDKYAFAYGTAQDVDPNNQLDLKSLNQIRSIINSFKLNNFPLSNPYFNSSSNWKTFKEDIYGFQVSFPDDWKDYDIGVDGSGGGAVYFGFYLPTTNTTFGDKSGWVNLFDLDIFTLAEWKDRSAMVKSTGEANFLDPHPTVITQNNKYVYTYQPAHTAPADLQRALSEVSDIIKTFKLTK